MDQNLLNILVCPLCKGPLQHDRDNNTLICKADRLAFPVKDGIPVLLVSEARELTDTPNDASGSASATQTAAPSGHP